MWRQATRIPGAIETIKNWYAIPLYHLGLRKRLILVLRNGLKFYYLPRAFGVEVFDKHPYDKLTVRGRDVIDVGAFVGDSALFFALRGARRVIAFEPFPLTFKLAEENLRLNTFDNIILVNEAVTSKDGSITIDVSKEISSGNSASGFQNGTEIPSSSLESIAKRFDLSNASLKLDCEGGEYDILGTATEKTVRPFSEIILEFHDGDSVLSSKLSQLGYKIEIIERHHSRAGTMLAIRPTVL